MGTIKKGILFGVTGKVGPVNVSSNSDKVSIVRIMPKKTTKDPKLSQLNQREIFKIVRKFIIQTQKVIKIGYQNNYSNEKPLDAASSYHIKNAVAGVYPDYKMDLTRVMASREDGGLKEEFSASVNITNDNILNVSWNPLGNYNPYELIKRNMDKVILLIYDETKTLSYPIAGEVNRSAGLLAVQLPKVYKGDLLHCYFFFAAADGKVSNSQYLGIAIQEIK